MSQASTKRRRPPIAVLLAAVTAGAVAGALIAYLAGGGSNGSHPTRTDRRVAASATGTGVSASAPRAPSAAREPLVPAGATAAFEHLAATVPGRIGAAVAPLGEGAIVSFGDLPTGHAWSTMKLPVLVTYMRQTEAADNHPGADFRALAASAVERSDNTAIDTVFQALEHADGGLAGASAEVQQTLQLAGDFDTTVNTAPNSLGYSTFGQTLWSAAASARFYRALERGCLLSPAHTGYLLGLMRNVEADQRWGAGSAGFTEPVAFKGGWGPEPGGSYLVRQTAIIGDGDRGYVLSMISEPGGSGEGSFIAGQHALDRVAAWAHHTFDTSGSRGTASCR